MNEWQAVQHRISCRSYTDTLVPEEKLQALREFLGRITSQTGLHMELVHSPEYTLKLAGAMFSGNVHTYAVFYGADDPLTAEKLGYYGEKFVLYATSLGLGTCWVAGTYDKKSVRVTLPAGEKIWDVILIGIATAEIPMKQKMIRTMLRKKDRKPEQFLESDTPLASAPDWVKTGIQAMLLGPSAVNQQPVNIVLSGGKVTMKIRKNGNSLQNNDMGIAKYQFAVGAAECGVKGKWQWGDGGEFEVQE